MRIDAQHHPPTPPVLTRQMVLLLVAAFGGMTSFYLLLSVVPLYAAERGGDVVAAGFVTGALMLATVLVELAVPRLLARIGYRGCMALGMVLLGAPAVALLAPPSTMLLLAVSLGRGAGLGIVVVVGSALAAELAPRERRNRGLAIYGAVVGVPAIVGVPAGILLGERVGFPSVFVLAALVTLIPLAAVVAMPGRSSDASGHHGSVIAMLRVSGLARPTVVFTAVTFAAGVFATFLPLAVAVENRGLAAAALLVQAVTMSLARLAAGAVGDRVGAGRLIAPAVLVAAFGAALAVWTGNPLAVIAGMALFGAGFGAAQNATLARMIERVEPADYGRTSALWNIAYDAGFGIGAVGFGLVVGSAGYPVGFLVTAAVLLAALVPAVHDSRQET
ncbi:MFS transporter [Pseudonocardia sp. TRM90224]|uniref:MFS transporter n=1 Tax=Pseudonocardia sp. TRM90224 TaxID=2812678 RepID=UPI001E292793|nr:MFS transporter [Pseudonocardia sp. TRM90224]